MLTNFNSQKFIHLLDWLNIILIQGSILGVFYEINFSTTLFLALLSFVFISSLISGFFKEPNISKTLTRRILSQLIMITMVTNGLYLFTMEFECFVSNQNLLLFKSFQVILFGALHLLFVGKFILIFWVLSVGSTKKSHINL